MEGIEIKSSLLYLSCSLSLPPLTRKDLVFHLFFLQRKHIVIVLWFFFRFFFFFFFLFNAFSVSFAKAVRLMKWIHDDLCLFFFLNQNNNNRKRPKKNKACQHDSHYPKTLPNSKTSREKSVDPLTYSFFLQS